jgi:hypothetical protein
VLAADGNVVMGGLSFAMREYQFARIAIDGSPSWVANLDASSLLDWNGPTAMLATADGGAVVAFGDERIGADEYVARIDGGGLVVWMRRLRAKAIAEVGPTRIVASGRQLSMLDSATGNVVWQTAYGDAAWTPYVVSDTDGAVYTTSLESGDVSAVKHDADGHIAWHVSIGTDDFHGGNAVGAANGVVYFMTSGGLHALRAADGSTAWTAPVFGVTALAGSPPEPIVFSPSGPIVRLDAGTGAIRWSTSMAAWDATGIVGDRLIVATDPTGRTLIAIDIASGAPSWTTQLPAQNAAGHGLQYFALGGLADGAFTVVGLTGSIPNPPSIERVALADGSLVGSVVVPRAAQGPYATSIASGTDHVAGVQAAWTTELPQVRVRRLETEGGAMTWTQDQILDLGLDLFDTPPEFVSPDVAEAGDAIAAAATAYSAATYNNPGTGAVWLGLYDAANGTPRWQSVLHDIDQGETHGSTPVADAAGNVYVSEGIATPCAPPTNQWCGRRRIYKLSHADGSVAWHSDSGVVYNDSSGRVDPPTLAIAGTDVLAFGPLDGSATLVARSVDSGALRWMSEVMSPAVYDVFPMADGILATGRDAWAKVDAATGATLWSFASYEPACNAFCYPYYGGTLLPNGNLLVSGEGDYKPLVSELTTDGSGTYRTWRLGPNRADVRSTATQVLRDSAGQVWLRVQRGVLSGSGAIVVLAKFDPATGTLASQQVVSGKGSDPLEPVLDGGWLGAPESDRLVISSTDVSPPLPTMSGNVAIDTAVTAHGDIAISLDVDHASTSTSQTIAFHARMTYSGDVPVAGAHLNVYLPWGSGVRNPLCLPTNATDCTLDTRGGHLRSIVDLSPGAVVDLTGAVLVVDANFDETPTLGAIGWGPIGLNEPDTLNNVARQVVVQGLFADGFDGR